MDSTSKDVKATVNEYDEIASQYTNDLITKCNNDNATVVSLIIIDKRFPNQPIIYTKGDDYDLAAVTCHLARSVKRKLTNSDQLTV